MRGDRGVMWLVAWIADLFPVGLDLDFLCGIVLRFCTFYYPSSTNYCIWTPKNGAIISLTTLIRVLLRMRFLLSPGNIVTSSASIQTRSRNTTGVSRLFHTMGSGDFAVSNKGASSYLHGWGIVKITR